MKLSARVPLLVVVLICCGQTAAQYPADMSRWTSSVPAYLEPTLRQQLDALRVSGAAIEGIELPDVENVFTEYARLNDDEPGQLDHFFGSD